MGDDAFIEKMKEMMVATMAEQHEKTKVIFIQEVKDEMAKIKDEIVHNIDVKINKTVEGLRNEIKETREKYEFHEEKITNLEKESKYLLNLQKRKNIMVYGLENVRGREERKSQLVKLFRDTMETSFSRMDLDYFKVLTNSREKNPVLIRMTTLEMKYEIFSKRKNLKGTDIYIDDDLDKEEIQKRKYLRAIMKEKKDEGKEVMMKRNKLYVDGELYETEDEKNGTEESNQNEDVEMDDSQPEITSKETNLRRYTKEKPAKKNSKRPRSPKEKGLEQARKKQTSLDQFLKKKEQFGRHRANSEGSVVTKIVMELEAGGSRTTTGITNEGEINKEENAKEKKNEEE